MALPRGDWTRRLSGVRAHLSRSAVGQAPEGGPAPPRRVTGRWIAGLFTALALGAAVDTATAHNPAWAAAAINTAHTLGLTPYRAVPFRQERLMPYAAVTVDDPTLPVGLHQIRQPGLTGTELTTGIALYRAPVPQATPVPARTATSAPSGATSSPAGKASAAAAPAQAPPPRPAPAPAEVKVLSSTVLAPPHQAVIAVGTSTSYVAVNGRYYHFARAVDMEATAYDATWASNGPWTGQRSAIGLPLDYGIVAVDPHVIPLGSRLYVERYGMAIAADTGSAIIGNHIDLFFWDSPHDIAAFGIQHLKVYVLDDPRLQPVPVPSAVRKAVG